MKRVFCLLALLFIFLPVFSEQYRISDVSYFIQSSGLWFFRKTQVYALETKVPIDKKTVFQDEDSLLSYTKNLETKYQNLRAFQTIQVIYGTNKLANENDEIIPVTLYVNLKDSFPLFAIPGPKYDSNTGLTFKLKLKDSNFLGSLNTFSSDLFVLIPTQEADGTNTEFGFNCNVDYPFKAGIFDALWLNDFGLSYTLHNSMPEWNIRTGLRLTLPLEKTSLIFETNQKFINDFQYKEFKDNLYFVNDFKISFPFTVKELNYFGKLSYTPYSVTSINWDFNYIAKQNSDLSSPITTIGHKLSFGRTDWNQNLRTGLNFSLDNSYTYNFQRQRFYPQASLDITAYKTIDLWPDSFFFRNFGLNTQIKVFTFLFNPKKDKYINNDGNQIGHYLRGIRDNQDYKGTNISALNPTSAFIFNFDLPIHIFTTNFTKSFFRYFNFDFQLSPFFDMALCYNKINQTFFNPKDGFYAGGLEVIVYPLRWSGITLRGSVGLDVGRQFFSKKLNMDWRDNVSKRELSIGFGLLY